MGRRPSQPAWLKAVTTALVLLAWLAAAGHDGGTSATTVNPPRCVEISA
jgi:hypothetical protein